MSGHPTMGPFKVDPTTTLNTGGDLHGGMSKDSNNSGGIFGQPTAGEAANGGLSFSLGGSPAGNKDSHDVTEQASATVNNFFNNKTLQAKADAPIMGGVVSTVNPFATSGTNSYPFGSTSPIPTGLKFEPQTPKGEPPAWAMGRQEGEQLTTAPGTGGGFSFGQTSSPFSFGGGAGGSRPFGATSAQPASSPFATAAAKAGLKPAAGTVTQSKTDPSAPKKKMRLKVLTSPAREHVVELYDTQPLLLVVKALLQEQGKGSAGRKVGTWKASEVYLNGPDGPLNTHQHLSMSCRDAGLEDMDQIDVVWVPQR
eukprot:Clim_evm5s65 gene=Clim_evmTU5s65